MNNVPELRFKEFTDDWKKKKLADMFEFLRGRNLSKSDIVINGINECIHYGELFTIYQEKIINIHSRTNLTVGQFSKKNDIYMPSSDVTPEGLATASTISKDNVIIGGDINILRPIVDINPLFISLFLNFYKKEIIRLVSGATVKHIYNKDIAQLQIYLPSKKEQNEITLFINEVSKRHEALRKKLKLLKAYKKGVMQKIFSQEIRFTPDDGGQFPEWEEKKLNELMYERKERNFDKKFKKTDVLSVSGKYGIVNQIEFQGRSFAGASVDNYHIVEINDIVYTKSPLKSNPYGIIKTNMFKAGIVSTLYAVYKPKDNLNPKYLDYYFQLDDNTNRYLRPLVHKGAKNDMKINNSYVLSDYITIPSYAEQIKVTSFLESLDEKIKNSNNRLEETKKFKKALIQQMFV